MNGNRIVRPNLFGREMVVDENGVLEARWTFCPSLYTVIEIVQEALGRQNRYTKEKYWTIQRLEIRTDMHVPNESPEFGPRGMSTR